MHAGRVLGARYEHKDRASMLPRKDANRNYRAHKEDGRLHRRKEDAPELRRHCALRGDDIRGIPRFEIGGV